MTGSRIRRKGADTVQPSFVLDASYFRERMHTNVASALNESPVFGPAANSAQSGQGPFGVGQNFVDLFSLGSQRTLTLVNGRRYVSSNTVSELNGVAAGQQVDLNSIPVGLVDRVETIAIGGAPVYGADAIAGTVNIILKQDYEGAFIEGLYGVADEGDARQWGVRGMLGGNFAGDRGNAVLAFDYGESDGLLMSDRRVTSRELFLASNPLDTGPTDGIPASVVTENRRLGLMTEGGIPLPIDITPGFPIPGAFPDGVWIFDPSGSPLQFSPDGSLVPYDPGTVFGGFPVFTSGGEGVSLADHETLLTPTERLLLNGIGRYRIAENTSMFFEMNFSQTSAEESDELLAVNSFVFGSGDPNAANLALSIDNPFLAPAARQTLVDNGVTNEFYLSRNLSDLFTTSFGETSLTVYRAVVGLDGTIEAAGTTWNWDASFVYGNSRNESTIPTVINRNLFNAIDAVVDPGSGEVVCRASLQPPPNADSSVTGCVPINLFGEGAPSAEAIAFVTAPLTSSGELEQTVFAANTTGSIPGINAERIGIAAGVEFRREEGVFRPDAAFREAIGRIPPVDGVSGSYDTTDAYAEFNVPILIAEQDIPALRRLSIEGSARYVDNSLAGEDWTWSVGARLTPAFFGSGDPIRLRVAYARSIRAPALTELFLPRTSSRLVIADPCDSALFFGGPNPAVREANCRAVLEPLGIDPRDFDSNARGIGVIGSVGGNPDLENERADSWTVGLSFDPGFLADFHATVDWIDIEIEDAIGRLSPTGLLQACFDEVDFPNALCGNHTRDAAGQITGFTTGFLNSGFLEFAGLNMGFDYAPDLPIRGSISFKGTAFYIDKLNASTLGTTVNDNRGELGNSTWQSNLSAMYRTDNLSFLLQMRWIDAAKLSNTLTIESQDLLEIGSYTLLNGSFAFENLPGDTTLRIVVNNILDEEAPYGAELVPGFSRTYDTLGRTYGVNLSAQF